MTAQHKEKALPSPSQEDRHRMYMLTTSLQIVCKTLPSLNRPAACTVKTQTNQVSILCILLPHTSSYYLLHIETKMDATQSLQLFKCCGCSSLHLCKHSTSRLHTFHGLSLFHHSLKCLVLLFRGLSLGYFRCHTSSHSNTAAQSDKGALNPLYRTHGTGR